MGVITGLTAARMLAIEAASVVSGAISGDNLILTKHDGSTVNAGNVRGPQGTQGIQGIQGPTGPAHVIPVVTALPGSPADGDEIFLQTSAMATARLMWHLRYRAAGTTYKWEFVGGPPIFANMVNGGGAAVTSYDTFAEGLQLPAVPANGVYQLELGFRMQHNAWPFEARLILRNPADNAQVNGDGVWGAMSGASGYTRVSAMGAELVTLTSTGVYRAFFNYQSNTPIIYNFWAKLQPVALG